MHQDISAIVGEESWGARMEDRPPGRWVLVRWARSESGLGFAALNWSSSPAAEGTPPSGSGCAPSPAARESWSRRLRCWGSPAWSLACQTSGGWRRSCQALWGPRWCPVSWRAPSGCWPTSCSSRFVPCLSSRWRHPPHPARPLRNDLGSSCDLVGGHGHLLHLISRIISKTLSKAQRTRGLRSAYQSNLMGHITSSNTNLDQTSSSKSRPSIHFKIHTKHHHLD